MEPKQKYIFMTRLRHERGDPTSYAFVHVFFFFETLQVLRKKKNALSYQYNSFDIKLTL